MNANLYLPGDELVNQLLAEFMGYFWCRYHSGQVVGERIVRFLMSPEQFEEAKTKFGPGSVGTAAGDEPIEQLAFRALPAYTSSRDQVALVEARIYQLKMWELYLTHLRSVLGLPVNGGLTAEQNWTMITADARSRARAAYLLIDSQRPKQQVLFG